MDDNSHYKNKNAGAADFLANERTFLAWIRTSIALMGFGFVIVKFAVFLRQVAFVMGTRPPVTQNRSSAAVGMVMVVLGALTIILAYFRYNQIQKKLQQNKYYPSNWLSILVTVALVIGSILLVFYLLPYL